MTRQEAPCRHQTDSSLRLLVILFCVCWLQPGSGPGGVIYIIHIIHVSASRDSVECGHVLTSWALYSRESLQFAATSS